MNAKDMKARSAAAPIHFDAPVDSPPQSEVWGSDVIAACLRALDLPYIALNPGASYRGLHDSVVNFLGNTRPQMLLTLHEESAVAIAQGYAKACERMMGAVVHSNVGLMHATMAVFNAWCDRAPVMLLGATGPWDAARRRPWIDWIHTVSDQGALVRDYTKWDNQPGSVPAAIEALLRAARIARTAPRGPVYVNLDAALQEAKVGAMPVLPDVARYAEPPPVLPGPVQVESAARMLAAAARPVILAGRVSRSLQSWQERIAFAETLQARVITDIKQAAAFPTDHPLHAGPPGSFLAAEPAAVLREADVIVSLDWNDLAGTLKQVFGDTPVPARVIQISLDQHSHRGWSADHQGLPPSDLYLLCEPDVAVPLITAALPAPRARRTDLAPATIPVPRGDAVSIHALAHAFNAATAAVDVCLTRVPLGWNGQYRHFRHPLDYLGTDGGGGIGSGLGNAIGSALALLGSGRLTAAIVGDGDFLMGVTALWTAAHYRIPLLVVVANNRSFFNDEMHQERVAVARGRPVENKWIGQRISEPDIDLAAMARAQGAEGIGPVTRVDELERMLARAVERVREGAVCVVDVRVLPGYDANMSGQPSAAHKR